MKWFDATRGVRFCVDDDDAERVSQHKWCMKERYIYNFEHGLLHHFIIGRPPEGMVVDHINQNTLDSRKENLRYATHSENALNHKNITNPDRYIHQLSNGTYQVNIWHQKRLHTVGTFPHKELARSARDEWLRINRPN